MNGIVFTVAVAMCLNSGVPPILWSSSRLPSASWRHSGGRGDTGQCPAEAFWRNFFEFASLPFSPGQSLRGTIHLRFNTEARHGIDLSLSCVRQVTTGAGKIVPTQETVLWQADKNVPQALLTPGPMGDATIPVDFSIPSDAYESYHDQPDDKVLWLLHAQADVPGVNYSDDFEVPVFRLTPSPSSASVATAFFSKTQDRNRAARLRLRCLRRSRSPEPESCGLAGANGGTEFYFPPFRNPGQVLLLLVITTFGRRLFISSP